MAIYDLANQSISNLQQGDIINCSYTGTYKNIELPPGTYQLETWGAQGGLGTVAGGKGGYSIGTLTCQDLITFYLYVGGQGSAAGTTFQGGFNGGGGNSTKTNTATATGGGGGSDIRINSTSLYARVIVAGGGGGGGTVLGGHGGGLTGGQGTGTVTNRGQPGTQTTFGVYPGGNDPSPAAFGQGGSGPAGTTGGGGGGGWYGGSFGTRTNGAGGGGSGYVYTSSTASSYPSGGLLNSNYYLENANTYAGNTTFSSPDGVNVTGHIGNGYIRITILSIAAGVNLEIKVNNSLKKYDKGWIKINNQLKEIDTIWTKINGELKQA